MAVDSRRLTDLFAAAAELPAPDRGPYLDRECGNDAELRERVEKLLQAHDAAKHFHVDPGRTGAFTPKPDEPPRAPGRLNSDRRAIVAGRYTLIESIGEGGIGALLGRDFDPAGPNESRSADITYIPTREGWLYLAVVEDLFSRMVVGWSMAETMESRLVVDALEMAVIRRRPGAGLLAHSDRGSQYASDHYRRALAAGGIVCSMSEVGQCWDNAPVESFFGRLKCEVAPGEVFATRDQAQADLFEYLEVFYNRVRRHSSPGFVSPAEFERAYNQAHR